MTAGLIAEAWRMATESAQLEGIRIASASDVTAIVRRMGGGLSVAEVRHECARLCLAISDSEVIPTSRARRDQ